MVIQKMIYILIFLSIIACTDYSRKHSNLHNKNNEFDIVNNTSLSIPPNFELNDPTIVSSKKTNERKIGKNIDEKPLTMGEEFLFDKIKSDQSDNKDTIYKRTNIVNNKSFFSKILRKKDNLSKDATQNPEADELERTYNKNKSLQSLKNENFDSDKVCDIRNGEIIYCNKNTFMKKFSFPTN